ncbi:growth hormone-inducible transmembrane protein-like [Branchiostoma lanceolatum]|uniref:growth hormone-inducible transmembrane protein-like n=1 Tax=Branchiostoma lanceolatum TaxID=7740 RepID=UPI003452918E
MLVTRLAVMPLGRLATQIPSRVAQATPLRSAGLRFFTGSPFTLRSQSMATRARAFKSRVGAREVDGTTSVARGMAAISIGQGAAAGAALFGIGALCYYGLGLSSEPGALEKSVMWQDYVKARIRDTYMYFGGGIIVTAATAAAVFRSPTMLNLVAKNSWLAIGATFAAIIGTNMITHSIPYSPGFGTKQLAWLTHAAVMGAVVAPLCFIGGPILMRAAWYTAGIVGGLSAVAVCAPSEKFLNMGGPLAIGLGVVFMASIGNMFIPPTGALGLGLYSISMYGGLILFGAFLLYDTQHIIRKAETYPLYAARPYDPVNASLRIYIDTLNIFIRIATLLSGGGSKRR